MYICIGIHKEMQFKDVVGIWSLYAILIGNEEG